MLTIPEPYTVPDWPLDATNKVLVLGLGNMLLQDEGIGVRAVENLLATYRFPDRVLLLDGGTLGLDLLPYLEPDIDLLILDAVHADLTPGTLIRLEGERIPMALAQKMSMHQVGLQDLLAACAFRGGLPKRIVLWGMQPDRLDWGTELTPVAQAALPDLIREVVSELEGWGVKLQ